MTHLGLWRFFFLSFKWLLLLLVELKKNPPPRVKHYTSSQVADNDYHIDCYQVHVS
jgi:hypothetical protein